MQNYLESSPVLYLLVQTRREYKALRARMGHQGAHAVWRERGAVKKAPKLKVLLESLLPSTLFEERETV